MKGIHFSTVQKEKRRGLFPLFTLLFTVLLFAGTVAEALGAGKNSTVPFFQFQTAASETAESAKKTSEKKKSDTTDSQKQTGLNEFASTTEKVQSFFEPDGMNYVGDNGYWFSLYADYCNFEENRYRLYISLLPMETVLCEGVATETELSFSGVSMSDFSTVAGFVSKSELGIYTVTFTEVGQSRLYKGLQFTNFKLQKELSEETLQTIKAEREGAFADYLLHYGQTTTLTTVKKTSSATKSETEPSTLFTTVTTQVASTTVTPLMDRLPPVGKGALGLGAVIAIPLLFFFFRKMRKTYYGDSEDYDPPRDEGDGF